jgi:molybdopterin converting factor small subunit|tara:strand:+ start:277 stop:543 length:267 start_codon:yes stop_codon:yes gene_type:complete
MEIELKLFGSSKILSENDTLLIEVSDNSNIKELRQKLEKLITEKYSKNKLDNLANTAAFFCKDDEIVDDNYKLKDKELISIIPPIGGG